MGMDSTEWRDFQEVCAGQPPAAFPGNWQVHVFYNGARILTENFTIASVVVSNRWTVRLNNIDDVGVVSVNGREVLRAKFGQEASADITSFLQAGTNSVAFTLENILGPAGYTYGFSLYRDGVLYFNEQCGIFNTFGCNNNDQTVGVVFTRTIPIRQ